MNLTNLGIAVKMSLLIYNPKIMNERAPAGTNDRLSNSEFAKLSAELKSQDRASHLKVTIDEQDYYLEAVTQVGGESVFVMICNHSKGYTTEYMFSLSSTTGTIKPSPLHQGDPAVGLSILQAALATLPEPPKPPESPIKDDTEPLANNLPSAGIVRKFLRDFLRRLKQ